MLTRLHLGVCGQVRPMKVIVTHWTKVNMAHQTSPYHVTILSQRRPHVVPISSFELIHWFVVTPLAMTLFITGYWIVPHSIQPVPKESFLNCSPINSLGGNFVEICLSPPAACEIIHPPSIVIRIAAVLSKWRKRANWCCICWVIRRFVHGSIRENKVIHKLLQKLSMTPPRRNPRRSLCNLLVIHHLVYSISIDSGNTYWPNEKCPPPFPLTHPSIRTIVPSELVGDIRRVHVWIVFLNDV